ncbi:transglycosylase domain-containing protein [Streptomyces bikiniensis]|uniref:transglycosylase domain-containing protein n=1 Tax=Streptomyces bikiniensis TaxID=1896 RepID=UPI0005247AF3|nr:transglycosylase domain-containing protein [Streptomyces bikiniensis]
MQLRIPEGGIPGGGREGVAGAPSAAGDPEGAGSSGGSPAASPAASSGSRASRRTGAGRRRKAPESTLVARLVAVAVVFGSWLRRVRPRYPRPGRAGWKRWVPSWRQTGGAVLASFGLGFLSLSFAYAVTDIPENLNSYATQQDNVYFWADGTPMARTGWVQRQAVELEDVPEDVRWAVLAAENESFYSDPGISFKGISRAVLRTVGQGSTQGGSTITQQYVKNVYLTQEQTYSRKFTEAMMALKLDNKMSKDEILEGYLNTSWFGRGTYGIQRAAQAYYGKDVSGLNASEAAFLASLLKGAGLYDPTLSANNRARAVERWRWTLDRMVEIGRLTPEERAGYRDFPEPLESNPLYNTGEQSDYLVELATQYAKKAAHISDKDFDRGGYQIYTTFDKKRVDALTKSVNKARDEARRKNPGAAKHVHYGAASVAADGRILAIHGGPDHRKQGYNESNATTVRAGSAFQPFVYAAALEHGVRKSRDGAPERVTGETLYPGDDGVPVTTPEGPYWDRSGRKVAAKNDGGRSYGRISLHRALALSVNTTFMQLGMDTGLDKVRATAAAAGLLPSSLGAQVPALSAGSSTPSAIRMAGGYATFAAEGRHTEPYAVLKVTRNGHEVAVDVPGARRAVDVETAAAVQSALTDAFRAAHPGAAAAAGGAVAGKVGTTEDDTAAWYVGTEKKVSTAVVVYRIDLARSLEPLPLEGLGGTAADSVPYRVWARALGHAG